MNNHNLFYEAFACKLPVEAWKISYQSRYMLQWQEAVFHGTVKDAQVEINHYINLFGVKSRKEGIVEALRTNGNE